MNRNVEIKARLRERASVEEKARVLASRSPELIRQEDWFFSTPQGRLKLRLFSAQAGELIYYERPDGLEPRESQFMRSPTSDPQGLKGILVKAYGVRGVVRKQRTLYLIGQTRLHLDQVEGLGDYLELEVVLSAGQTLEEGSQIARQLIQELGIQAQDLVDRAYIDLLESQKSA